MGIEVDIEKKLEGFRLNIRFKSESRRIGILGASGCGKSLTLKSIAGIESPDAGRIVWNDGCIFDSERKINISPQKRKIGYLFQNYALFPTMTVEKNIGISLRCGKEEKQRKVSEMIKRFHLEGLENRLPGELSGGQQQRVALARILIYEPEVILLDEPFSALDVYLRDKMQRECMEMLKDYPGTVILVSHSRDEIYRFSEETIVIDAGRIIGQKPTKKLFENPEKVEIAKLTGCKNIMTVQKAGEEIRVPDWGISMEVPESIDAERVVAVGIRAHEFEVCKPVCDPFVTFPVWEAEITEDLFEYNISFLPRRDGIERIDWKVSKYQWDFEKQKMPQELYLKKSKMLWLEGRSDKVC